MEWKQLEDHFRSATKQDPCQHGDDAIEWDHSRYSRALGLVGNESLQQRRRAGIVHVSAEPARWDKCADRCRALAESEGWSLLRVSAWPTVAVPDPCIHALGDAVSADGLIFLRSGRGRRPRVNPDRGRPDGASFPLRPADRWLIAADRVRRRMRNEIAERGLVLLVEDAHKLTASAMNVLSYLVDAHCAWQARMLARDARVYVVLVAPPEQEQSVAAMLERFSLGKDTLVVREQPSRVASPKHNGLGVEEEHLLAALHEAPLALTADDLAALFGASALNVATRLVEDAKLNEREEDGQRCFVPPSGADVPKAPERVTRALLECYRERLRAGHEHLLPAMAALAFRLGEPLRAIGFLGRVATGNTATVAEDLRRELDEHLSQDDVTSRLKGGHVALWACMRAHQRDYKGAQELAAKLSTIDLRSPADFGRVLAHFLGCGRTHTDEFLEQGFWASLQSSRIDPSLFDAACIFGELVACGRMMNGQQIADRYKLASVSLAQSSGGGGPPRQFARLAEARFGAFLHVHRMTARTPQLVGRRLRAAFRSSQLPSYLVGSISYGLAYAGQRSEDLYYLCTAQELLRGSANHYDLRFCVGERGRRLTIHGLRLLGRDIGDELVLSIPHCASETMRFRTSRALQMFRAPRAWLSGLADLAVGGRARVREKLHDREHEIAALADALTARGDYASARSVIACGFDVQARYPVRFARTIVSLASVSFAMTSWEALALARDVVERNAELLGRELSEYCSGFIGAVESLSRRQYGKTIKATSRLLALMRETSELRELASGAIELRRAARQLDRWRVALQRAQAPLTARHFEKVVLHRAWTPGWGDQPQDFGRLGEFSVALEEWAVSTASVSGPTAIGIALWLRSWADSALGEIGQCTARMLANKAPSYFERLRLGLAGELREYGVATDKWRTVDLSLRVLGGPDGVSLWKPGILPSETGVRQDKIILCGSRRSRARRQAAAWSEDASVYSRVSALVDCGKSRMVAAYGVARGGLEEERFSLERDADTADWSFRVGRVASGGPMAKRRARSRPKRNRDGSLFLGTSPAAEEIRSLINKAAECDLPVLILGDTGCGKELVARSIHMLSRRSVRELVVADCSTTVDSLLESDLFGHERGAFTGASAEREGLFLSAHGSTVLLDEVDSMGSRMQAALLRVLETGQFRPVGSVQRKRSDFRVLAAGLPCLLEKVSTGDFRSDLYYRLGALRIQIPPLRKRLGDAIEIARAYAGSLGKRLDSRAAFEIEACPWPGNVRQLRHCLDVASLAAPDGVIGGDAMADAIAGHGLSMSNQQGIAHTPVEVAWRKACRSLARVPLFGTRDFAREAGVSRRSAQRYLSVLVRGGRVVKTGAGRATLYSVSPPQP